MKKLLIIVCLSAFLASCGDGGSGTPSASDSTRIKDSIATADSLANANKMAADTTHKMADTTHAPMAKPKDTATKKK